MNDEAYQPGRPDAIRLRLTADRLAVCRLDPNAPMPAWALEARGFLTITRTADEVSIMCATAAVPPDVRHEGPFRLLTVEGPLPFDAVGVIAGLAGALAAAGVSLLAVGTYDTDHLLVREQDLDVSLVALAKAGYGIGS